MNKVILWLLLIIAAACAWEDDCPMTVCYGRHVDTQCDINHCGECDIKCSPNQLCIDGVCTCPNNNNACGPTCTACRAGQHCDDYQCVCDNVANSCGTPGSVCTDCTQSNSVCSNGVCMCPNIDSACSSANCGPCGGAAPSCCGGKCVCPNTPTQCTDGNSGAGTCSTCNVESGEVCVNGACGCCVDNTCTQCPRGSTGCTPADASVPGSCCLPGGSTCTAGLDCCSGTCTGSGFCTGCVDLNSINSNSAVVLGTCDPTPGFPAFTQASCRASCTTHELPFSYYSLTYQPLTETTIMLLML
jgi:hypothetical protein